MKSEESFQKEKKV